MRRSRKVLSMPCHTALFVPWWCILAYPGVSRWPCILPCILGIGQIILTIIRSLYSSRANDPRPYRELWTSTWNHWLFILKSPVTVIHQHLQLASTVSLCSLCSLHQLSARSKKGDLIELKRNAGLPKWSGLAKFLPKFLDALLDFRTYEICFAKIVSTNFWYKFRGSKFVRNFRTRE